MNLYNLQKSKKNFSIFVLCIFLFQNVKAQHFCQSIDTCAKLTMTNFKWSNEFCEFDLNCKNICNESLLYYKPILDTNECFLLRLYLVLDKYKNMSNREQYDSTFIKTYAVADYDFSENFLNQENSVLLNKDETFSRTLRLKWLTEYLDKTISQSSDQEKGVFLIALDYSFLKNTFTMEQSVLIKRRLLENGEIVYDFEFIQ